MVHCPHPIRSRWLTRMAAACLLILFRTAVFGAGAEVAPPPPSGMVLTNAEQIRELTAAEASRPFRIHLRGVKVSEAGPSENSAMILADATASVYVIGPTNIFSKT